MRTISAAIQFAGWPMFEKRPVHDHKIASATIGPLVFHIRRCGAHEIEKPFASGSM